MAASRAAWRCRTTTRAESLTSGPVAQGYNPYAHSFSGMGVQFILFIG